MQREHSALRDRLRVRAGGGSCRAKSCASRVLVMGRREPPHFTDPKSPEFDAWVRTMHGTRRRLAERTRRGVVFRAPRSRWQPARAIECCGRCSSTATARRCVRRLALDAPVWAAPAFGVELIARRDSTRDRSRRRASTRTERSSDRRPRGRVAYQPLPDDAGVGVRSRAPRARRRRARAGRGGRSRRVPAKLLERLELFDRYDGPGCRSRVSQSRVAVDLPASRAHSTGRGNRRPPTPTSSVPSTTSSMSDNERPDIAAVRELMQLVRHLGDELAGFRRRALAGGSAPQGARDARGGAVRASSSAAAASTRLEHENAAACRRGSTPRPRARSRCSIASIPPAAGAGGRTMTTKKNSMKVTILGEEYAIRSDVRAEHARAVAELPRPGDPAGDVAAARWSRRIAPRSSPRCRSPPSCSTRRRRSRCDRRVDAGAGCRYRAAIASPGEAQAAIRAGAARAPRRDWVRRMTFVAFSSALA